MGALPLYGGTYSIGNGAVKLVDPGFAASHFPFTGEPTRLETHQPRSVDVTPFIVCFALTPPSIEIADAIALRFPSGDTPRSARLQRALHQAGANVTKSAYAD